MVELGAYNSTSGALIASFQDNFKNMKQNNRKIYKSKWKYDSGQHSVLQSTIKGDGKLNNIGNTMLRKM